MYIPWKIIRREVLITVAAAVTAILFIHNVLGMSMPSIVLAIAEWTFNLLVVSGFIYMVITGHVPFVRNPKTAKNFIAKSDDHHDN